jgi:RNA polymerase sigma-70 factor, ECF subfamily
MPKETSLALLDQFLAQHARLAGALHAEAKCERWGISTKSFAECLRRSAERHFAGAQPQPRDVEAYLKSLHLEDLALACACSQGIEKAWEEFVARFREDLRNAAGAILRASGQADETRAEELADSLYAELYGVRSAADGRRKSLFEYFHGRSKLSTWLRALLAQKQVDVIRTSGRMVSLDGEAEEGIPAEQTRRADQAPSDPHRDTYLRRFEQALSASMAGLTPRERMILACYYVDRLTLAEIGRMQREHESTVSRQLERMRQALRESVTQALRSGVPARDGRPVEPPLDEAQVELAFEYSLGDWPFDLSRALSDAEAAAEPPEK